MRWVLFSKTILPSAAVEKRRRQGREVKKEREVRDVHTKKTQKKNQENEMGAVDVCCWCCWGSRRPQTHYSHMMTKHIEEEWNRQTAAGRSDHMREESLRKVQRAAERTSWWFVVVNFHHFGTKYLKASLWHIMTVVILIIDRIMQARASKFQKLSYTLVLSVKEPTKCKMK